MWHHDEIRIAIAWNGHIHLFTVDEALEIAADIGTVASIGKSLREADTIIEKADRSPLPDMIPKKEDPT